MSKSDKKEYRTLLVGLGGSGGHVLTKLNDLLTPEQKAKSHMIYIDLDKGDASELEALGMNTVLISSSDTVRDVIERLGPNDGVADWIPQNENDKEFLSSKTDDGASQYRIKSRLCLANFLRNRNNKLAKLLGSLCTVGSQVSEETLRVMIVSSVAGGTGAGTFIEVALYIREFFRNNNHSDVNIMGLFACPDLFKKTLGNKPGDNTNLENMYANAYAAIRELNAMNLAVSTGGLEQIAPGYGKSINIKIHTKSEGKLFDPKDAKFLENANNKPFNLLYFVDTANEEGGVLTNIEQYYAVMADIVHTRLYSPIEEAIRSGESNELGPHSKFPTAIYGSAGYGRIIYPYEDIIRYLAVRKTADEVGGEWFAFEDAWVNYCKDQEANAAATGTIWTPTAEERAQQYVARMEKEFKRKNSRMITLKGMMVDADIDRDRASIYLDALKSALTSAAPGGGEDGAYSRCSEEAVRQARDNAASDYNAMREDFYKDPLGALQTKVQDCLTSIETYGNAMAKKMEGTALSVASIIVPQSEKSAKKAELEKDAISLFYGLLTAGGKPVHPLAARYLLYKLRAGMKSTLESSKTTSMVQTISDQVKSLNTSLDTKDDGIDMSVQQYYEKELKRGWKREKRAGAAVETFMDSYNSALGQVTHTANSLYIAAVYEKVLEYVEELIAQYEGLFDNLEQYKTKLEQKSRQEKICNNSAYDDRCIFVNASAEAKAEIYERDPETRNALREGDQQIAAAAGKGIYDALMTRTWKKIDARKTQLAMQFTVEEKADTYSDLSGIFDEVTDIYATYLKEKASHLKMSVVEAVLKQCCLDEGIDRATVVSDPVERRRLRAAFEEVINDMIAKSYPMLAYDPHNADTYYKGEDGNTETKSYMHIGMHPSLLEDLLVIYGENDTKSAKEGFEEAFAPSKGLTLNGTYDRYIISCFSAVHCLQPTQILKFREDSEGGYYTYYKKRLATITATGCLSFTPHLDKRWHLREAMPYISRSMEQEWHKKTTKAFIYELLKKRFTFTTTADGYKCFNYQYDESAAPIFVYWPENRLVTVNDLSRLVDYLEERDERVEDLNLKFDQLIEDLVERLSKSTETIAMYKTALTTSEELRSLRERLCVSMTYSTTNQKSKSGKRKTQNTTSAARKANLKKLQAASRLLGCDESVEALEDIKSTLGGLLQVAYLIHKSEERQGRDKDYGEAIIGCALEIVEKLCLAMFGANIPKDTADISDYKDLYNSIIEKFMEAFVKYQLVQRNMFTEAKLKTIVGPDGDGEYITYNRYLLIPNEVVNTAEYRWVTSQWKLK